MKAVVTTGAGGYDKLEYKVVSLPVLKNGEVLVRVLAAGVNNTDINTRIGWYDSSVTSATDTTSAAAEGAQVGKGEGWNGAPSPFPLIQGTDCCGRVVAVKCPPSSQLQSLVGRRVLIRSCMRRSGMDSWDTMWLASDFDGAFAQFVKVPLSEVFPVNCGWSDVELASLPCAYGTAENMLERAQVGPRDHVCVPGASGGVGSAVVQLAKRRGAKVTALCGSSAKTEDMMRCGADQVLIGRSGEAGWKDSMLKLKDSCDVVVDNVAGEGFEGMVNALKRGGRYVTSGAISGPIVRLDLRAFYLRDLKLIGCTAWAECIMHNLVGYVERGEIKPLVSASFPLEEIVRAQKLFLEKKHVGKIVLVPPAAAPCDGGGACTKSGSACDWCAGVIACSL